LHVSARLNSGIRKISPFQAEKTSNASGNGNFKEIFKKMLLRKKKDGIIIIDIKSGRWKPLPPPKKPKAFSVDFLYATFSPLYTYISLDDGNERTDADSQE